MCGAELLQQLPCEWRRWCSWCLCIDEKSIHMLFLFMLFQGWMHLTARYFDSAASRPPSPPQKKRKKREREGEKKRRKTQLNCKSPRGSYVQKANDTNQHCSSFLISELRYYFNLLPNVCGLYQLVCEEFMRCYVRPE